MPEVLSTLTGLRSLRLGFAVMESGWEHLRPLSRQLSELSLVDCGLRELPRDLAALQELEVGTGGRGVAATGCSGSLAAVIECCKLPPQVLNLSYTALRQGWKYLMKLPRLHKLLGREPPWAVRQAVQEVGVEVDEEDSDSEADYPSSDSDAEEASCQRLSRLSKLRQAPSAAALAPSAAAEAVADVCLLLSAWCCL